MINVQTVIFFFMVYVVVVVFIGAWLNNSFSHDHLGKEVKRIMALLDDIIAKVEAERNVVDSAVVLLGELKTKLDEAIANDDTTKLQELSDAIGQQTDALSAAVTANTPAAE